MSSLRESLGFIKNMDVNYQIDGTQICVPASIRFEDHALSRAWTDATALLHDIPVRRIQKLELKWMYISKESLKQIMDLIDNKYDNNHSSRHTLTVKRLGVSKTYNVTVNSPIGFENEQGVQDLYKDFSIAFTEVDGVYLL